MDKRSNFLALILLDALDDENESDVYKILERNSVDASFVPRERGISPLHYTCGMDNVKFALGVTRRFLESGANPNVRSDENMTPLHVAAIYGRVDIVRLLLQHGALLDVVDDERKTPVNYAIEECHFEVVKEMRDHIFLAKLEHQPAVPDVAADAETLQSSLLPQTKHSLQRCAQQLSTPTRAVDTSAAASPALCSTKQLLASRKLDDTKGSKYTPNRINYNYDATSPYYINITHRRHKPQPTFPAVDASATQELLDSPHEKSTAIERQVEAIVSPKTNTNSPSQSLNLFSLTKERLNELSQVAPEAERSRLSIIETWREKVQRSRARLSILKQYDDIGEMIDNVMAHDHLNFTNTVLRVKDTAKPMNNEEVDSGACASTASSLTDIGVTAPATKPSLTNMSLGKLIQRVAQAHIADFEPEPIIQGPRPDAESSYQTVPEIVEPKTAATSSNQFLKVPETQVCTTWNIAPSPNSGEYFLQMTEAYVHTDDENGLVFYETKLLSHESNNQRKLRGQPLELDTTATSQSTNITVPPDYETDALRAELTTFGEPPGPITKSTKRLYIKRLVKYKRKTALIPETLPEADKRACVKEPNDRKFSVELQRTVRSSDAFQRIAADTSNFEQQSMQFFANHQQKRQLREGHLKQSFLYMLIDPRISCNLPGESVFLSKFDVWRRFLRSIFYVGKGKTSRPYSHLYDAMKTHSRMHNQLTCKDLAANGKKISIKKQPLNAELFKSPAPQSSESRKLDRILNIWASGNGVVCLHIFHNIVPTEAYTREAAIIDALGLLHLTNIKRGDYYGPARTWTMKQKKYLGIALLYKAMQIYVAEGESQLSPSDLI